MNHLTLVGHISCISGILRLDPPYGEIFKIRNIDLQFQSPGKLVQKKESDKKKGLGRECLSGLRHYSYNRSKGSVKNPTRRSAGHRDPISLGCCRWPSGRNCRNAKIDIGWVRLIMAHSWPLGSQKRPW